MTPLGETPLGGLLNENERTHALIRCALTHRSRVIEQDGSSNERLEFLGDAVLELVVSETLYRRFPDSEEGRLTKMRSALVSRRALSRHAVRLGVLGLLCVGQEDARTATAAANACEALIGAVYLISGLSRAQEFVIDMIENDLEKVSRDPILGDYKSLLHEMCARDHLASPSYRVSHSGPDHARRYRVEVVVMGKVSGVGEGASRKRAEQEACRLAIEEVALVGGNEHP